jgi:D-sedoheptulose 7-phosphate isomerase
MTIPDRQSTVIPLNIDGILDSSVAVARAAVQANRQALAASVDAVAACIASGHKVLIFGNGGSAADSQHIAAELVNRFKIDRPPMAAIALTTDSSILTSIANDSHFNDIFARQVRAIGQTDDLAWGISTSGNSTNVTTAIDQAATMGLRTLAMTGSGGRLASMADIVLRVPSDDTARIQEAHILMAHMICALTEERLYPGRHPA